MDVAELRALLSPEGLRLLDEVGTIDATADVVRIVSRLRGAGHSGELVAAVLGQARLRAKARAKFGEFAGRMLFTPDGLEQATRLSVASLHAGRFAGAGIDVVADLGCGIGADALAMAALDLGVLAVERDEATAAIASFNLAPFAAARVELGDATTTDLTGVGGVWLDPARRAGRKARSTTRPTGRLPWTGRSRWPRPCRPGSSWGPASTGLCCPPRATPTGRRSGSRSTGRSSNSRSGPACWRDRGSGARRWCCAPGRPPS